MSFGIALAGGGLKGLAYIGVIKALEELEVNVDYLSGTSSGSIFASFYAMGFKHDEIKEKAIEYYTMLTNIKKKPVLKAGMTYITSGIAKIEGLIQGENIEELVRVASKEKNIINMNEIKIPYAIAAVDTITTKECFFLSKHINLQQDDIDYIYDASIATATRASMSFPGIFTPCKYKQYNFIDGGTKENLPVKILRDMGAEKVLALSFKIDSYEPKEDVFSILLRAVDIFSLKEVRKSQKEADLALEIDASGTSLLKVDDIDKIIKVGYDTIINNKEQILKLIKVNK